MKGREIKVILPDELLIWLATRPGRSRADAIRGALYDLKRRTAPGYQPHFAEQERMQRGTADD